MHRINVFRRTAIVLTAALTLAGCGDDTPTSPTVLQGSFVGRTSNPDLFVGVATSDGRAVAYLCNGSTVGEWFSGSLDGSGRLAATSRGGSRIELTLTEAGAAGFAVLSPAAGGTTVQFNAALPGEGIAGLYRAVAQQGGVVTQLAGWVVLPNGQRGALRTSAGVASNPQLDLATLTAGGLGGVTLRAEKVTGFMGKGVDL
jgi:hypothetical protein